MAPLSRWRECLDASPSFSVAAEEAELCRIYLGQHFRTDHGGKGPGGQGVESIDETILLREE
jgi:hypothetical protein